jgi:SulP family sulfate permease
VIVGTAINHIDFCGVEALELLHERLLEQNIQLNLAEFKGPVMDQLARSDLLKHLSAKQVFFTASDALKSLQNTDKSKDDDFYTI